MYGYDALYRLSGEAVPGAGGYTRSYDYDLAGNLLLLDGSPFATYDPANKISALAGGSVLYDGDGNLASLSSASMPSGSFAWDDRNKLVGLTSGGATVAYGYDGRDKRVWSQAGSAAKTFYLFDGDLLIGEVQNGAPSMAYSWGADGLVSQRLLGTTKSFWFAYGPQGETRQLTNGVGAIVDTYSYSAYGVSSAATNNNPNHFRYGGKFGYYSDGLAGLMLCGARWYNPFLTRWMSRDPLGFQGGANNYLYVSQRPTVLKDADGLDAERIDEAQIRQKAIDYIGDYYRGRAPVNDTLWNEDKYRLYQLDDKVRSGQYLDINEKYAMIAAEHWFFAHEYRRYTWYIPGSTCLGHQAVDGWDKLKDLLYSVNSGGFVGSVPIDVVNQFGHGGVEEVIPFPGWKPPPVSIPDIWPAVSQGIR